MLLAARGFGEGGKAEEDAQAQERLLTVRCTLVPQRLEVLSTDSTQGVISSGDVACISNHLTKSVMVALVIYEP